jgi:serine/threonine protein kinase
VLNKKLMAGREHLIRNEINILKQISLGHKNVLTLHDYFETQNNLYLVVDLALGGELFDRIVERGNFYEKDAAQVIYTVLSAVRYLHDHGIVHRDLKPENLLFRTREENSDLLIADFGLSRIMEQEKFHLLTTTCGTPGYMAPEVFRKIGYGKPVDLWAVGVITYFLLCGYTPFDRESSAQEMQAILSADYSYEPVEYWQGVSAEAKSFIDSLLKVNPSHRMTARQALQHPWIVTHCGSDEQDIPPSPVVSNSENLAPGLKRNFSAKKTFKRVVDMVKLVNAMGKKDDYAAHDEHVVGEPMG